MKHSLSKNDLIGIPLYFGSVFISVTRCLDTSHLLGHWQNPRAVSGERTRKGDRPGTPSQGRRLGGFYDHVTP